LLTALHFSELLNPIRNLVLLMKFALCLQLHDEYRAFAYLALDGDGPAHEFDECLADA
jgi:hypothetical protein